MHIVSRHVDRLELVDCFLGALDGAPIFVGRMGHVKSRTEETQSARRETTIIGERSTGAARRKPRTQLRGCGKAGASHWHEEVSRQVAESAQDIVRANVEKAKAGSLSHTKWLCGLVEQGYAEERAKASEPQKSLAEILLEQLRARK